MSLCSFLTNKSYVCSLSFLFFSSMIVTGVCVCVHVNSPPVWYMTIYFICGLILIMAFFRGAYATVAHDTDIHSHIYPRNLILITSFNFFYCSCLLSFTDQTAFVSVIAIKYTHVIFRISRRTFYSAQTHKSNHQKRKRRNYSRNLSAAL